MTPDEGWWLATAGNTLIWARLRVLTGGTAEVLDCDGATLPYDSEDSARAALMDAEFVSLDGIDADDAAARGFDIATISPPDEAATDGDALRRRMIVKLPARR